MKAILGFSLIELMVVIAIVALLAAVAMPAYNGYVGRVNLTKGFQILNDISNRSIDFAMRNGYFPSITELGYPAGSTPESTSGFARYGEPFYGNGNDLIAQDAYVTPCGASGFIWGIFKYDNDTYVVERLYLINWQGKIYKACSYIATGPLGSVELPGAITGCFDETDPAVILNPNLPLDAVGLDSNSYSGECM